MDIPPLKPFGPDATCTLETCPVEWSVFQYRPSFGANLAFICLYFTLMCVHTGLGIRWRSWWFMGCMIVGCVYTIIGYGGRIMLYFNPFSFSGFMLNIICVGSGPVFYSAAIYVTITKTVENLDPSLSRIRPKLYYIIFITCDVGSLVLQAVGGALSTTSNGSSQAGVDLALVGLSFQVATMVCFCGLLADYLARYNHHYHHRHHHHHSSPRRPKQTAFGPRLKLFLASLGLAVLLILARCAYRVVELSEGYGGRMIRDEALFVALEGVLVVLAVAALCVGHPGFVFASSGAGWKRDAHECGLAEEGEEEGVVLAGMDK